MNKNKSIVKNSIFLYIRMFLMMAIGFYTTRVLLEALGVEDLGIYNVVGSLILIFDFVSSGLSNSTQRFINIGLGTNDKDKTRQYFSQCFLLHVFFAFIIIVIAETVGLWIVYHRLQIPADRFSTAIIVYHISVFSVLVRFVKICFDSDIIAREQMSFYAYVSILEGIGKLAICYGVIYSSFDRLITYAILLLLVNFFILACNICFCLYHYPETHVKWHYNKQIFKQLTKFIGVNSFGVLSWALGHQGVDIILNLFFGPIVNGAKGLAATVDRVIKQFGTNIDLAVRPRITKLYAQNQLEEMMDLAMKSSKFIYYVIIIVSLPFLFYTEPILSLWLKNVPPYTCVFVKIMMFQSMAEVLGLSFNDVSLATGKIRNIQIYGRFITLSALPVSYIILKYIPNPYIPQIIMAILSLAYTFYMVYDMNKLLHFGMMKYACKVLFPVSVVTSCVFVACLYVIKSFCTTDIFVSFVQLCFMEILTVLIIFLLGTEKSEKTYIFSVVRNKFCKTKSIY